MIKLVNISYVWQHCQPYTLPYTTDAKPRAIKLVWIAEVRRRKPKGSFPCFNPHCLSWSQDKGEPERFLGAYRDNPDWQGASFTRRGYPLGIHSMLYPCIEASLPVLLSNGIAKERHQEAHLGRNTAIRQRWCDVCHYTNAEDKGHRA